MQILERAAVMLLPCSSVGCTSAERQQAPGRAPERRQSLRLEAAPGRCRSPTGSSSGAGPRRCPAAPPSSGGGPPRSAPASASSQAPRLLWEALLQALAGQSCMQGSTSQEQYQLHSAPLPPKPIHRVATRQCTGKFRTLRTMQMLCYSPGRVSQQSCGVYLSIWRKESAIGLAEAGLCSRPKPVKG